MKNSNYFRSVKISAAIISYNEAKNIADCIRSIAGLVDEIVIVDSGSTDGTQTIAKQFSGVRFIMNAPFPGHIEQKNIAMNACKHDWVLSLDADERISEELKQSIVAFTQSPGNHIAAKFNRLNNYCGQWIHYSGWYPDEKIRLWNRKFGKWGGINPHDKVEVTGEVAKLNGDLLHFTFNTKEQHQQTMLKYAQIAGKALFEQGKSAGFSNRFLNPAFRILRDFIFKRGFLDGKAGWAIAWENALYTYRKYEILHKLRKQSND